MVGSTILSSCFGKSSPQVQEQLQLMLCSRVVLQLFQRLLLLMLQHLKVQQVVFQTFKWSEKYSASNTPPHTESASLAKPGSCHGSFNLSGGRLFFFYFLFPALLKELHFSQWQADISKQSSHCKYIGFGY